ncbi:ABC transporter ATP-binding protein [Paenibacillus pini]|uniref:Hydroxymethylpyrimidine ABC transporter n=1 Tax=Paenibacillus pini JCM 16418 TaxID=1236976 RepID=W7YWZ7_9BACL|nr:ABC transporter ATP-binding protein [Paenibacillus pini]GAF09211.1 hydroxymethylpyrimidine ABC transporter [Paenibacillus pini JCM 16418]
MNGVVTKQQTPALSVRGLTYSFPGERPLFDDLSFDIQEGEFVSLLAASGMGKTTLFRLLAGLIDSPKGEIVASGRQISLTEAASKGAQIGYMPQKDCLMPWRTVLDNAALGLELNGTSKRVARMRVMEQLPLVGLEGTEHKYPHELSGGMRQRVSFLRSLLGGADVLLLDEPFSALDAMTRINMQEWLLQVWEQHRKTIVFVTHDVDEALLLSDRVLVAAISPVTVLEEIIVPIPRPRKYETVMDAEFIGLKRQVLSLISRTQHRSGLEGESL